MKKMNLTEMKNTQGGFCLFGVLLIWFCVGVIVGAVGVNY